MANNYPISLTPAQIEQFDRDGFLIVENFLTSDFAQQLAERIERLFHGEFETGIYPDEWYWRPGMSLDYVTREICNAWKSDRLPSFIPRDWTTHCHPSRLDRSQNRAGQYVAQTPWLHFPCPAPRRSIH